MEKESYRTTEREQERQKFQRTLASLEATEGYWLLKPTQRQILRVSQHLQSRAERMMMPGHKNDSYYYDWNKQDNSYQPSLDHIYHWYCHAAVNSLENEKYSGVHPDVSPSSFYDGQYFLVEKESRIKEFLESFGFPCVVHIGNENGNLHGEAKRLHSFLALGHDQKGNIVTWEKIRQGSPYRVSDLSTIYRDYGASYFWGVRKLRD